MTRRIPPLFAALSAVLILACSGPFLIFPGGEIEGTTAEPPPDWSFTDAITTVEVETRPEDPYSVNLWIVAYNDLLYLHAGANRSAWVVNLEVNPRLRVSVEGTIYEMEAARVTDGSEFAGFADAYEEKYGSRPRNENVEEIYLYRLAPH